MAENITPVVGNWLVAVSSYQSVMKEGDILPVHESSNNTKLIIHNKYGQIGRHWALPTISFRYATEEEILAVKSGILNIKDIPKFSENYQIY